MILVSEASRLLGRCLIPASKSHTIRAVLLATLAHGASIIRNPLESEDAQAALTASRAFRAEVETTYEEGAWRIEGIGGLVRPPDDVINIANSGTSCRLAIGAASLGGGYSVFTGDASVRSRPMEPLLAALRNLGAEAFSTRGNGKLPVVVRGPLRGGRTAVEGFSSQFLSSLLLCTPLSAEGAEIHPVDLRERPYVEMTLLWLDRLGIRYERDGYASFRVPGGQHYEGFDCLVPGDFSTATFALCAAAMTDSQVTLQGLDMQDCQADKAVVAYLRRMGADIAINDEGIHVRGGELRGCELDLCDTPDALPALAVVGCVAAGETRLVNVPQARVKETDRIAAMRSELKKLGADIEEREDGLVVRQSALQGGLVEGYGDHRIVMSLAIAGLVAKQPVRITTAEAVNVSYPRFLEDFQRLGAALRLE
ncbi:MAG: 3-phosphoshikimate 1-carboxyvinyltransferase [Candidatus Tectomicrobia bacterium]|nr:3-phosphoshikimate 1-carboxyvinyltransferase [Candidatus Tectomicrobia bacterium]